MMTHASGAGTLAEGVESDAGLAITRPRNALPRVQLAGAAARWAQGLGSRTLNIRLSRLKRGGLA